MGVMRTLTINGVKYNVVPVVPASSVTLSASAWTGDAGAYSQVVAIPGVTANTKVDLQPTAAQLVEFHYKVLGFVAENDGGVVTVYAIGDKPKNDHTIQITLTEVEGTGKIRGNTVGTTMPRSDLSQTDPTKASYVAGREMIVLTVNGVAPDENGNVEVAGGSGGGTGDGDYYVLTDADKNEIAGIVLAMDALQHKDGKDGVSATHSWSGTTLTITSASGTSSADLKGDKGDDYKLTDADKQEIAEIAQAMVDVGGGASIVVDSAFNAESENPVMNKTITAAMGQALEAMGAIQQDITNLQNSALPTVTTADNDKFLQVVDGKWYAVNATQQVAAIVANYVSTMFVPLTQEEYDALATVDPNKYYMIVGDSQ